MSADPEIYEPKIFYAEFVRRAYDEYLSSPIDQYRAKTAVMHADIMAERTWKYYRNSAPKKIAYADSPRAYRKHLVGECPDFQLVWDICDGHKHVSLDRRDRKVSSAAQTGIRSTGGALGADAIGAAPLGGGTVSLIVTLDDGSVRNLVSILTNVIAMWEKLLSQI
jgi:hypothetical protein